MNNKLTKVGTLYVPVSVKELNEGLGETFLLNKNAEKSIGVKHKSCSFFTELTNKSFGDNVETHYLKEQNNKYILSEEEIVQLISNAIKGGEMCQQSFGNKQCDEREKSKDQYIKQMLNKQ